MRSQGLSRAGGGAATAQADVSLFKAPKGGAPGTSHLRMMRGDVLSTLPFGSRGGDCGAANKPRKPQDKRFGLKGQPSTIQMLQAPLVL